MRPPDTKEQPRGGTPRSHTSFALIEDHIPSAAIFASMPSGILMAFVAGTVTYSA
jgi:hypothetical protein